MTVNIRNMSCWIVKTECGREVVSCEFAERKDEIYMFLDGEKILSINRVHGIFLQKKSGDNFHGPFKSKQEALDYSRTL